MTLEEIKTLHEQICEDINTITINHFIKLNDLVYTTVYNFTKIKPKHYNDNRFLKSLNKYFKIIYGYDNKKLLKLIK